MGQADDLALRRINIKSWKSPVAKQYRIKSIPHLVLFDNRGRQILEGKKARGKVLEWNSSAKEEAKAKPKKTAKTRTNSGSAISVISTGDRVDIRRNFVRGKYTAFLFMTASETSVELATKLKDAAKSADDLVLRVIDMKSLRSPVAVQYRVVAAPHIMLFDKRGKLIAQGKRAAARALSMAPPAAEPPGQGK